MNTGLLAMMVLTGLSQGRAEGQPPPDPPGQTLIVGVSVMRGNVRRVQHVAITIPAPPAPVDQDEDEDRPLPRNIGRINLNSAVVDRDNFDRWLFGDAGDPAAQARRLGRLEDPADEAARGRHLERLLQTRLDAATREHKLTLPQRAKLQLAGRGDIKRFFDQVEDRRREFETERRVYKNGLAALRRLEPLRQVFQDGPFGDSSLFAKTLQRINDEQGAGR
jgi:hypothetical protein